MMTATDRYKRLLADALERVCVLEEQNERQAVQIAELEGELAVYKLDESQFEETR